MNLRGSAAPWRSIPLVAGLAVAMLITVPVGATAAVARRSPQTPGPTVTFAEQPGAIPNYILPLVPSAYCSVNNVEQLQYLVYRPLYWFGKNGAPVLNASLSLAGVPVFNAAHTEATITLKHWRWSDGQPITTRDIEFYLNLLTQEKSGNCYYVPGQFPDNVTKVVVRSATTMSFYLNHAYDPTWFTYNELAQITPLPQQVWDRTSLHGAVGNSDEEPGGARAVYAFLSAQASRVASYSTSPLWRVVDGPWRLTALNNLGDATFVPNPGYSGPVRARIGRFNEVPYASATSEVLALQAGEVDYGYLPLNALSERSSLAHKGFRFSSWPEFGIGYFPINFNNPKVGPIFRQLYVRQAMQSLVNQTEYIKTIFKGYATPTYGPVPISVPNPFTTAHERRNPYPFDPGHAAAILRARGWRVEPGAVTTCRRAGTGAADCGAGIKIGAQLNFNLQYASGNPYLAQEMQALKSDFSRAGIAIQLSEAPFNTVFGIAVPCRPAQPACAWQMEDWGSGWTFSIPNTYPSGDFLFRAGAATNAGSYNDARNNANIQASDVHGISALYQYEDFLARQVPVIWMPLPAYQLSEIRSTLSGAVPQDPYNNVYPEIWTLGHG